MIEEHNRMRPQPRAGRCTLETGSCYHARGIWLSTRTISLVQCCLIIDSIPHYSVVDVYCSSTYLPLRNTEFHTSEWYFES